MSTPTRFEIAAPDCVAEDFDGEIVVLNLASGRYFSLRDLAAAVWRDLAAGHDLNACRAGLAAIDGGLAGALDQFVVQTIENQLLRPGDATAQGEPTCVAMARGGARSIALDAYDDMKDLLLTDPIHDVDPNIGWPVRRQAE